MKRNLATWLALLLVLALMGCGKTEGSAAEQVGGLPGEAALAKDSNDVTLDLSKMSGTVVYAQVYQMIVTPEAYEGARIRVRGELNYYRDPHTNREYFAAVIQDATACCAQGMEFVWRGEHCYPDDYPPLGTEITVTGVFGTYWENGMEYVQLGDAEVSWNGKTSD